MKTNDLFWKNKLAAFLHDPPGKAFDIGGHYFASESLLKNFGLSHEDFKEHVADHVAAAADRFPFPHHSKMKATFSNTETTKFQHPFCDCKIEQSGFPSAEKAEEEANKAFTGDGIHGAETWQEKFWLLWRRWPEQAALHDARLAYLPADTRIPDHTIWNHNSMVSALEGCRVANELKPAFLMFQAGPVQSFISESRSTRDLWSGSYMLSWLMARVLHEVAQNAGPDSVIFPALRSLPLLDVMNKELWDNITYGEDSLWSRMYPESDESAARLTSPTIPNRFLAVVPEAEALQIAKNVKQAFVDELKSISEKVWIQFEAYSVKAGHPVTAKDKTRFDKQIDLWPQLAYQIVPWDEPEKAMAQWENLPKNGQVDFDPVENLEKVIALGKGSPYANLRSSQQGLHWPAYVSLCDYALAARRNTRSFQAYKTDAQQKKCPKDPLTGREEVIGSEALWEALRNDKSNLFNKENPGLGATSLLKRLWCREETGFLTQRLGISGRQLKEVLQIDSVEDIAKNNRNPENGYVAILALDGDEMGKWVSGAKLPLLSELFAPEANAYFGEQHKGVRRPLSPSYHLQFSEALATFATRFVEPIVRDFGGQLILAGGDDVLAMLPADSVLDCAVMLRAAFRGVPPDELFQTSRSFTERTHDTIWETPFDPQEDLKDGVVMENVLDGEKWKSIPRIVPGPRADVSVGIAVGHFKHPLQQLVKAAQAAEKVAKNDYGRAACQVRLLKRGGEEIHWGFKWASQVLLLYHLFTDESNSVANAPALISGGFPSAFAARFSAYGLLSSRHNSYSAEFKSALPNLLRFEFADVLSRQAANLSRPQTQQLLDVFDETLKTLLQTTDEVTASKDLIHLFLTSSFLNRQSGDDA